MPQNGVNDDNEIDLDADEEIVVDESAKAVDPGEIVLDDNDEAGDNVCYVSESAIKRPRV
jgi:hypothetical protein